MDTVVRSSFMGIKRSSEAPTGKGPIPGLEEVFDAYHASLYRFARGLTGEDADASDLVQEAFYRYARSEIVLRDPAQSRAWLFTTLHRLFLRQRDRSRREPSQDGESLDSEVDPTERDLPRDLDAQRALAALAELEEKYRGPLTLFYLHEIPYKEIATILEIPVGTVMSRISRGKSRLAAIYHEPRDLPLPLPLP